MKHPLTTQIAWQLVQSCGPHQAARQRTLAIRYLSWLGREPSGHLTGDQKKIKADLGGRKRPAPPRPPGKNGKNKKNRHK